MSKTPPQNGPERSGSPRYQPLVIVLVAVCLGIGADRLLGLPLGLWWGLAVAAWAIWLGLWRWGPEWGGCLGILLAVVATAAAWHHCRWCLFDEHDLGNYARVGPGPACVEAIALKGTRRLPAPERDPMQLIPRVDRTWVEIEILRLRDGVAWRRASGRVRLLVDGHLLGVHAGDRLRIFARLTPPRVARNPGESNAADYHRADRRLSVLRSSYPECVSVVRPARRWTPSRLIETVRSGGNRLLWRYLDHRRSGLAAAVLLGDRGELGAERWEAFRETGTVHLLAISGLHVGILAWLALGILRLALVPRHRALLVVAVLTVLYTILTDARPPAIRATILVLVMCCSHYLGRRPLAFNSLAAAALVVLALNPADLFRIGAQLSFLCVAALMWFAPSWFGSTAGQDPLDRLLEQHRTRPSRAVWFVLRSGRHLTLVSATIWLFTLPLAMARFHLFVPIAVLLNTVLWIPMTIALGSGFVVLIFGLLFPPLASIAAWCCDACLWALDSSIATAREIPAGHFWVPGPADWWLVGFYGSLAVLAAFPRIRPPRRWCLALLAGWIAVGFAAPMVRNHRPQLACTFLAVDHGCSIVLELPSGETMLYDAGQMTSPHGAARSIAGCLWSRGVTHLDAVVLSHADADHYNALPDLIRRFSVGVIYVSPMMFKEENESLVALRRAIEQSGVPIRTIYAGDRLRGGAGCRIEVLHPTRRGVLGGDNANSIVLCVEYHGRRILLTGDLESQKECLMICSRYAYSDLSSSLLLAPNLALWENGGEW